jgi:hypothetical protein
MVLCTARAVLNLLQENKMSFMKPKVITPPPPPPPPPEPDMAKATALAEEATAGERRRRKGAGSTQVAGLTSSQATTAKPTLLG